MMNLFWAVVYIIVEITPEILCQTVKVKLKSFCKKSNHFQIIFFFYTFKGDAIHLYRDVVLLTEDRHLKLKAHTRNVPVKDIKHFCKWSGLLSNNSNLERSNYNRPKPK